MTQNYHLIQSFSSIIDVVLDQQRLLMQEKISRRFKLVPGTYVIIPSTFGSAEEGDFIFRIIAEKMPHVKQTQ